jgi:ABC-2 type transport system ATP-binding protein
MSPALLAVRDARKRYGEVEALRGVALEVGAGEAVALLGPNGAGKSTLIRCLTTLLRPDSGAFEIAGADVVATPAAARRHFGYAGQESALDKVLTGAEMLRFQAGITHLTRQDSSERSRELLRRFGLEAAAGRAVETYSGGMRRRLDLACALMHRPRVLILDEPSSGLDYEARRGLWAILAELKREGVAILLATHDFEEAETAADRCVLLAHGRVVGAGAPQELRAALGAWVLTAALAEHPRTGDRKRLAELFAALPGTPIPPAPGSAEFAQAVPRELGDRPWPEALRAEAARRGLALAALGQRLPTLQDAYLAATGAPEAA